MDLMHYQVHCKFPIVVPYSCDLLTLFWIPHSESVYNASLMCLSWHFNRRLCQSHQSEHTKNTRTQPAFLFFCQEMTCCIISGLGQYFVQVFFLLRKMVEKKAIRIKWLLFLAGRCLISFRKLSEGTMSSVHLLIRLIHVRMTLLGTTV